MPKTWTVTWRVHRKKGSGAPHYDTFTMEVDPDEYVIDAVERIWAVHDRSLTFAHACHHSTCGACGMRVNQIEKLVCITLIREITEDGGQIQLDPLRHFPVISDLVVDLGPLYRRMEQAGGRQILPTTELPVDGGILPPKQTGPRLDRMFRLADCIECGLCMSACPIVGSSPEYLGPAVLAAMQQADEKNQPDLFDWADSEDGAWRCHGIHECTEVCPSNVEPAWRIMDLRKQLVRRGFRALFGGR